MEIEFPIEVGDIVRIKVFCTVVDSNSSDTLTPILKFGGSNIATGAALDVADDDIVYAVALQKLNDAFDDSGICRDTC